MTTTNSKGKAFRAGLAALVLAGVTTAGLASAREHGDGPGHGLRALRGALAAAELTDAQKVQVKAAFEAQRPAFQALREQAKADHEALRDLLQNESPDATAVGKAFLRLHADREQGRAQFKAVREQLKTILTPEQMARVQGYGAAMRHGMGRHAGPPAESK